MTVDEALGLVDEIKPNQLSRELKTRWLSDIDGRLFADIISTHEPDAGTPATFSPYDPDRDGAKQLLIPEQYSEVYRFYLEMQIDLANMETAKYNNSMALFTTKWQEYARKYNREHPPLQGRSAWIY